MNSRDFSALPPRAGITAVHWHPGLELQSALPCLSFYIYARDLNSDPEGAGDMVQYEEYLPFLYKDLSSDPQKSCTVMYKSVCIFNPSVLMMDSSYRTNPRSSGASRLSCSM